MIPELDYPVIVKQHRRINSVGNLGTEASKAIVPLIDHYLFKYIGGHTGLQEGTPCQFVYALFQFVGGANLVFGECWNIGFVPTDKITQFCLGCSDDYEGDFK